MAKSNEQVVQIFGLRSSNTTRAAERFFKERRIKIHFVDLAERSMSPGEIGRFVQKFGLNALLDIGSKVYKDAGLEHLRISDQRLLAMIEDQPKLLRLPLLRFGNQISLGDAQVEWRVWLQS